MRRHAASIAVQVPLLVVVGFVQATNVLHWPASVRRGHLRRQRVGDRRTGEPRFYTYSYGHPPLSWLLITIWTWAGGLFGHAIYSLDGGRELMCVVAIVSCSLLYTLARRLEISRVTAGGGGAPLRAVPACIFFHRAVLLDNPVCCLGDRRVRAGLSPTRRLWASRERCCFAASVLSKETTLVMLPALVLAAIQNADRRTRRYCLALSRLLPSWSRAPTRSMRR